MSAMDLKRIKELIDLFADSDLGELNFSEDGCQLRLVRHTATPNEPREDKVGSGAHGLSVHPATDVVESAALRTVHTGAVEPGAADVRVGLTDVVAPLHGVFHLTPSPDEPPYVNVGDEVKVGQILGTLEAMKMFHTLKSDVEGFVAAILVASGSEVEAGQPLFRIT
jgi:acetyl-CoA carboxylase biotin carboxyl carrier protein